MSQEIRPEELTQLHPAPRSAGDGMESSDHQVGTTTHRLAVANCSDGSSNLDLPKPTKRREPKFVPYEPYKAAVAPMLPARPRPATAEKKASTKLATLEIPFPLQADCVKGKKVKGEVCPVISVVREVPEGMVGKEESREDWAERVRLLENNLEAAESERKDAENQLRVQLQVNSELKKLLVASLGEDVQARVQFLSEDKAKLAEDISFYSAKLQEGMEEMDRISIQCDVWRTKFLASSLVIDELAKWKSRLTHQCEDFQESLQWLTNEHQHLETNILATYRILSKLQATLLSDIHNDNAKDGTKTARPDSGQPKDLLQIAAATQRMARGLYHKVHGGSNLKLPACPHITKTPAEKFACRAEQAFEDLKASFRASSTAENSLGSSIMSKECQINGRPSHDYSTIACCRHCSGHKLEIV